MIGKPLLAFAGLFLAAPAVPQAMTAETNDITVPSPYRASFEVVPRIECGTSAGSGVRISDETVITATHVADNAPCTIGDVPVTTVYNEPGIDLSAVRGKFGPGFRAIISCEGIIPGERYLALGYAHGGKPNVEPLIGTNKRAGGKTAMLRGKVYRGMSGGAILNSESAFVAITVQTHREADWAYVVPLSETYLCRNSAAR